MNMREKINKAFIAFNNLDPNAILFAQDYFKAGYEAALKAQPQQPKECKQCDVKEGDSHCLGDIFNCSFFHAYDATQTQQPVVTDEMIAAAEAVEDLYRRGTPETWKKVFLAMWREMPSVTQPQQTSSFLSCHHFMQDYEYVDSQGDTWTENSLASSAQDFLSSASKAYDEYLQSQLQ